MSEDAFSYVVFYLLRYLLLYTSRKLAYIILTPEPHFYIVKVEFTGVYIKFLISAQNIDCWYSLEPPRLISAQNIDCGTR